MSDPSSLIWPPGKTSVVRNQLCCRTLPACAPDTRAKADDKIKKNAPIASSFTTSPVGKRASVLAVAEIWSCRYIHLHTRRHGRAAVLSTSPYARGCQLLPLIVGRT